MKIGITGGIGSGKSTVSEYLLKLGYEVVDADLIAREITMAGSETLNKLAKEFGPEIIETDGNLNRKKLGEIVFTDKEKRNVLDSITHREIYDIILDRFKKNKDKIVFLDAALLFETGLDREVDAIWVIVADKDKRVQRVVKRDETTAEHVLNRIESQLSDEEKEREADYVIDNTGTKEELYGKVRELLVKYV